VKRTEYALAVYFIALIAILAFQPFRTNAETTQTDPAGSESGSEPAPPAQTAPRPASSPSGAPSDLFRATAANIRCDWPHRPADYLAETAHDTSYIAQHQAGMIGTQENCSQIQSTVLASLGSAYGHYIPSGGGERGAPSEVPIFWKKSHWSFISAGYVNLGSMSGFTPRHASWVLLKNRATGRRLVRVNTHWISGAWKGDYPERQQYWVMNQAHTEALIRSLREAHPSAAMVITGDFNHKHWPGGARVLGVLATPDSWTSNDSEEVLHVPGPHLTVVSASRITCRAPDGILAGKCQQNGVLYTDHGSQAARFRLTR
jgi:hypothetical protein